jgi:hypothetical protein
MTFYAELVAQRPALGLLSNTVLRIALALGLGASGFRDPLPPGFLPLPSACLAGLLIWG